METIHKGLMVEEDALSKFTETLTKEQAIQKMEAGHKVTHQFFSDNEFITMENGMIVTEEGYPVSPGVFWSYRKSPTWNSGWYLFNK